MIVNITASVPYHGQDWAAENCQAGQIVCFTLQPDQLYPDKVNATAFDMKSGNFLRTKWLPGGIMLSDLIEGNGNEYCWYDDQWNVTSTCQ